MKKKLKTSEEAKIQTLNYHLSKGTLSYDRVPENLKDKVKKNK
jgi:hypothetical protein